jgi:hypothetical protein
VLTLEGIQEKTCKEAEISNDLEKEIVETKKSLVRLLIVRTCSRATLAIWWAGTSPPNCSPARSPR